MKKKKTLAITILARLAPAIALLLALSCSGGSSSGPNYNALLNGVYILGQFNVYPGDTTADTSRVEITANGYGSGTFAVIESTASGGTGTTGTITYSVAVDRTFTVASYVGGIKTNENNGYVSADGSMFVVLDTDKTDGGVILAVGLRKSSALTDAVLSGDYQINQIGYNIGIYTARVAITADGSGGGTWSFAAADHSASLTSGAGNFTYAVSPNGALSVTTDDGAAVIGTDHGIVSADGSLFVISDANPNGGAGPPVEDDEIVLAIGIRTSSGLDSVAAEGKYRISQVGVTAGGVSYTSRVTVTATPDGPGVSTGVGTFTMAEHSEGAAGTIGTFDYTVASDGIMSVTTFDQSPAEIGTDHGLIRLGGSAFALTDTNATPSAGPPVEEGEIILGIGMYQGPAASL